MAEVELGHANKNACAQNKKWSYQKKSCAEKREEFIPPLSAHKRRGGLAAEVELGRPHRGSTPEKLCWLRLQYAALSQAAQAKNILTRLS